MLIIYNKKFCILIHILILFTFSFAQESPANIIVHAAVPPLDGSTIACNDQSIVFNIAPAGSTGVRMLILAPPDDIAENPEGYDAADWGEFIDTLRTMGFSIAIVPHSTELSSLLPEHDILALYGYPGRLFSSEEMDSIASHLSSGGGVLSIVRAPAGDTYEIDVHNPILALAAMSYSPPRLSFIDSIPPTTSHPIVEGIDWLSTYKSMSISASPEQHVILTGSGDCICAADSSSGGRIVAIGEEHIFQNGPLIFAGIPAYRNAFDNAQFGLNIAAWLSMSMNRPGCGIDIETILLTIDVIPYDIFSLELSWDGHNLIFSPPPGYWTSGSHAISLQLSDSCGHSVLLEYTAQIDVDAPRATLMSPPTGILLSSGDSARIYINDYETPLDTSSGYIVIDGTEYFSLHESCSSPGFTVLPEFGWSMGPHEICIHAEDSPDFCSPNPLDTCMYITLTEDTLRSEISEIWIEGCSLVYTEVCVFSGATYIKDLILENFSFYENGIPVIPPSLEQLSICPGDSAMVDIVLLFDFSLSMENEADLFAASLGSFVAALGLLDYRISCIVFNGCPDEINGAWLITRTDFSSPPCTYNAAGPDWWATNITEFSCLFDNVVVNELYDWPDPLRGSGDEDQYGAIVRAEQNLDFREDALKAFILFTDERPIVSSWCDPIYDETEEGLDSIIAYCLANNIVVLPVTPEDGEFEYASSHESPERAFYEGYYLLGDTTGGRWFNLYMHDYDSLATQIGIAIHTLPCCYLFRYREEQFCSDDNLLIVDVRDGAIGYGMDSIRYVPPCPGWGEFTFPESCGGITTCARLAMQMKILPGDEYFALNEDALLFDVSEFGTFDLESDELSISYDPIMLEFTPLDDYANGDTICGTLIRAFDTLGCPIPGETCCFIVDLQPPLFFDLFPPPDTTMENNDFDISIMIYDSIAGVRWDAVSGENFVVIVNGDTVEFNFSSAHPYVHIHAPTLVNHDTVTVCAIDIPDNPDYDYCPPNYGNRCWTFYINLFEGPIAERIMPPPEYISACEGQEIWIAVNDTDGVDSATIVVVIAGDTFTCADEQLAFIEDTLFFTPPDGFWSDGQTVDVGIVKADDLLGTPLQNPFSWTFYLDFSAPLAQLIEPPDSSYVLNEFQPILIDFWDNLAGISLDSTRITIAGSNYALPELLESISPDSLDASSLLDPNDWGIIWFPGDTINISTYVCDMPDTCGPNCDIYSWVFYMAPPYDCRRVPNPFTPNGDGINDYAQFTFPGLLYREAAIHIFDIHSIAVNRIRVPIGLGSKETARWYGIDEKGRFLPQGLYIYIIEVNGEVICEGTITIAR